MKKFLLFTLILASFASYDAMSQCGRVSLIGEFNGWAGDHFLTRNPETPASFTTFIYLTAADDPNADGIIELKFRENADWTVNWGSDTFPTGTAVLNGPNIPVPYGNYKVSFDCSTGAYNFETTCGDISMIGEFNGWAADYAMTRNDVSMNDWMTTITLNEGMDPNADGIIELKFRQNADWGVNWGGADFPVGVATQDGPNVPVPYGNYKVMFNCSTGNYEFVSTCGEISIIGEFNGWAADHAMHRADADPNMWSTVLSLTPELDGNADGIIELKFRQNADWGVNWGSDTFPTGIGVANGPNIPVPLENPEVGITTDYFVTFNCSTGEYNFVATVGPISMIGAFNGWNGDIPMNRDMTDPNIWKLSRAWYENSEVKFRENMDWTNNWGSDTFPTGTGTSNGPNIPLVAGTYDVTFNSLTAEYSFVANANICGEIGMVGDFNNWGTPAAGTAPTDVWMVRDPMYPSQFSIEYNFTSSTGLLFRLNADPLFEDVWGGTSLCQTGVQDASQIIQVPGGKYRISFNCKSGDYCFERLGNAVIAPKVFAITVNGSLDESDWVIDQTIAQVVDGELTEDPNVVVFGVTYTDEHLYIGINVTDAVPTLGEQGEVFIDGNKNGGVYDEFDLHLRFTGPTLEIIQGPAGMVPLLGFMPTATGYMAELGIPWADLGITPEAGNQIGFDIIIGDDDSGTGVAYRYAWNGGMQNYEETSSFGDLNFGVLSCGCISLFNETTGDIVLQNPTDMPTTYVGTYELDNNFDMVFRKDMSGTVTWGSAEFPNGTAVLDGAPIPATTGRYRITFDCLSGTYTFADEPSGEGVAYADYIDTPVTIDGDLSEYTLSYGCDVLVAGAGPNNNTVTWGARWDGTSLYLGANVVDAVVEGAGNPWDNDAIEFYFDGNHDSDETYDGEFDTQLILDALNQSTLWIKADGVQIADYESNWTATSNGYNVELRLGWADFGFLPGSGRSMGFSLGNNDSDNGLGRDYQTVWFGTGNNWSNTADLGDLQLQGGPYYFGIEEAIDNASVVLYPNPTNGDVFLRTTTNDLNGKISFYIMDMSGRLITTSSVNVAGANTTIVLDTDELVPGIYFINIVTADGRNAVKKMIKN